VFNILDVLGQIVEKFEPDGWYQTSPWFQEDDSWCVVLKNDNDEELPIQVEVEITDEEFDELADEVCENIDIAGIEESLQESVTKSFEEEGYKQNNYWEYDPESDTYWASFIDFNLDGIIVSIFGLDKEDIKKGNW